MLQAFSMFVLLGASAAAVAGPPAASESKAKDPKRKICEAVEETGSRLSSKRICMTAEQWEAQRGGTRAEGKRSRKSSNDSGAQ